MNKGNEARRAETLASEQHDGLCGTATSAVTSADSTMPRQTNYLMKYASEYQLVEPADVSVWANADAVLKLGLALRATMDRLDMVLGEFVRSTDGLDYEFGDGYKYVRTGKFAPDVNDPYYPDGPQKRIMHDLCVGNMDALRIMMAVERDAEAAGEVAVYVRNQNRR